MIDGQQRSKRRSRCSMDSVECLDVETHKLFAVLFRRDALTPCKIEALREEEKPSLRSIEYAIEYHERCYPSLREAREEKAEGAFACVVPVRPS